MQKIRYGIKRVVKSFAPVDGANGREGQLDLILRLFPASRVLSSDVINLAIGHILVTN